MSFIRKESNLKGIVTLWLDAPDLRVNVLSQPMWAELSSTVDQLALDRPTKVIIASAKPGSFAIGADNDELNRLSDAELDRYIATGQQIIERLRDLPVMTVAAINGDCLGSGLELAMACRARVCADDPSIRIGLPEVRSHAVPAWGGTFLMRRLVGLEEAVMLAATGQTVNPQSAARMGLVDRIIPFENLMAEAIEIHGQQAKKSNAIDPRRIFEWADARIRSTFSGDEAVAPLKVIHIMRNGMMHGEARERSDEREAMLELRHLPHSSGGAHA